jgi:aminopeptidase
MDPRIREHAAIVANHSIAVAGGENVVVAAPPEAEPLVVALAEVLGDAGAHPLVVMASDRADRAFLRASGDGFETPAHRLAMVEAADAYVKIRAGENETELGDVAPETQAGYRRATQPVLEERLSEPWCLTQYPTPSRAQLAEMSTAAYENFVWDAITKDWDAVRKDQARVAEAIEDAEEVRIVSGETTDVTMGLADNPTLNDYGEKNLPGGEVFTAPVPDSVEGEVLFDLPLYHQGREVEDAHLRFEAGEVVEHGASKNEATLTEVLETDDGARRLGELGVGMNRDIDRFTYNMLFDEKMGDTVHMAVGRAYEDTVAAGNRRNDSAVHVDMIVDMSADSRIELDGDVVQRDGAFWFEDGF